MLNDLTLLRNQLKNGSEPIGDEIKNTLGLTFENF